MKYAKHLLVDDLEQAHRRPDEQLTHHSTAMLYLQPVQRRIHLRFVNPIAILKHLLHIFLFPTFEIIATFVEAVVTAK